MTDMVTFYIEVPFSRKLLEESERELIADMAAELASRAMRRAVECWKPEDELFKPDLRQCCDGGCGPVYRGED